MDDLNIVALVGRLTADPELRSTAGGTSLCSLRVAFNSSRKNASGAWEEVPGFVNVTVWGGQAESCANHLAKGRQVAVRGRLQWREWESDGVKRSALDVVADRVQFIGATANGQSQTASPAPAQTSAPEPILF